MVTDGAGTRTLSIQRIGEMHLIHNQMHFDGTTVQPRQSKEKQSNYGQFGFFSIHFGPLWSIRKISTGGPERSLFAAISKKIMLRTNATGSSRNKPRFLERKSSIASLRVCIKYGLPSAGTH